MRLLRTILAALLPILATAGVRAQEVTGEQVRAAIDKGNRYLLATQGMNGRWPEFSFSGGTTALATLALLNAGVPTDDAHLKRAISAVRDIPLNYVYVVSLKAQALAMAGAETHRDQLQKCADWLSRAQQANGMWGYTMESPRTDFSNSQFALLGLHEAAKGGAKVAPVIWARARGSWVNSQNPDGGWGYMPMYRHNTGSMTAAGVASLFICGSTMTVNRRSKGPDGSVVCCQAPVEYRPIARGIKWLTDNFSARTNPSSGAYYFYYMYALERVGILSGLRYLGEHDWYREGAAQIIARQDANGSWREVDDVVDTAFCLLFLAKGHKPVLFNKLQWSSDPNHWNLTRNDLPHLLAFIGDRLGEPMSWEAVAPNADVREWLTAPILYFNGQEFPKFQPDEIERFREYIRQGGTLFISATCNLAPFRTGFEAFAKAAFPEDTLIRLPADHPLFQAVFRVDGTRMEIHGINTGCRTSVIFSPRDIPCLWDLANVPVESEQAFQLGTNLAAYATGLEPLPDKLDAVRLAAPDKAATASGPARSAVQIAQLMHNGDWRPNPKAIPNLSNYLHEQLAIDVVPGLEPLAATDARLARHPIVYLTGHYTFELKPEEIQALRKHLQNGGFLLADACCGRQAFDTAFRKLMQQLFPDHPLEAIPLTHPIVTGQPGIPLTAIQYRPAVKLEQPSLRSVQLEGVTLEGRLAVVYSRYSLDCAMDGHKCFACRGLEQPDALRVAGNVILHALSF